MDLAEREEGRRRPSKWSNRGERGHKYGDTNSSSIDVMT